MNCEEAWCGRDGICFACLNVPDKGSDSYMAAAVLSVSFCGAVNGLFFGIDGAAVGASIACMLWIFIVAWALS